MTPQEARSSIDRMLAAYGCDAILQYVEAITMLVTELPVRVKEVDFKPAEMVNGQGLETGDQRVILSGTPFLPDKRVPEKGDRLVIDGVTKTVLFAWPKRLDNELVRVEMAVRR